MEFTNPVISSYKSLISGFIKSVTEFPEKDALFVQGKKYPYKVLFKKASALVSLFPKIPLNEAKLIGVFARRSLTAYTGVIASLLSGSGYVPLNPTFPIDRTLKMIELSQIKTIIVDENAFKLLPVLISKLRNPITFIIPDNLDIELLSKISDIHTYLPEISSSRVVSQPSEPKVIESDIAYLLFTSGSTGVPKGVMVTHKNITHFLKVMLDRFKFNSDDHFSQTFEMTFDLSVFDMFLCWSSGACLFSLPPRALMAPAKFIKTHSLTVWFAVPSIVRLMQRMRMLKESSFPTLRYSLFCGEPLTYLAAELWQKAANNSILENLYGPTEVTIACLFYRFDLGISKEIRHYKTVPIGEPNPGLAISIVDSNLNLVPQGESGELCLSGPQVVPGYWYNEEKAAQQFVHMPWDTGYSDRWYRTGDLVKIGKDGMVHYIGRIDNQVKILGYRVELEEIEEVLRQFLGQDSVVALAWPVNSDTPVGIIAFIVETRFSDKDCIEYCASKLPEYMVPREIRFIKKMPLNSNGKINRSKLLSMLEQEK